MANAPVAPIVELVTVPGAQLHTETRGAGPLLLCIVGSNGDAEVFSQLAARLADRFTVVSYDRRGFGRSPVAGPVDDATRLARDADDAAHLIAHRGEGPAFVLGSSSGAIVGLDLLARHPDRVRTLIAHEPPLMTLVPDRARWLALLDDVHATYLASGVAPAMTKFHAAVGLPDMPTPPPGVQLPPHVTALLARVAANQTFWLEHELLTYPRFAPDLPALRAAATKLVLGVGREPAHSPLAEPARALAAALPARLVELPGNHIGYVTAPADFARELVDLLG